MSIKNTFLVLAITMFCFLSNAQKFTLNELFEIQQMDLGKVNDTLLSQKWKFYKSEGQTENRYAESIWYYGKLEKYKAKAEGWFYFLSADTLPNRIIYQFQKIEQFDLIKTEIDKSNFKEIGTKISEGNIVVFYKNKEFVVGTTVFPEDNVSAFAVTVYTIADYLKLKGIKEEAIKKKN